MAYPVAIDAMGGDRAPSEIVKGAVEAARADPELHLFLVGQEDKIGEALAESSWQEGAQEQGSIELVHADLVIGMGDTPVDALRKKRGSSIEVATRLVKSGKARAVVSAGNTGACVAASTLLLGLLPRVRRAGIAVALPAGSQPVVVINAGANINPKPVHMIQYGLMASLYASEVLRIDRPRVGLINVGEESEKGNSLAKEAHAEFVVTELNYVGNVEGGDVFRGGCDVVVCDGFVGNVLLKVSEGLAEQMMGVFKGVVEGVSGEFAREASAGNGLFVELMSRAFANLKQRFDYAEYGGAPLLGVDGVTIIAHGRSDARAIANAVRVAKTMVAADFNRQIIDRLPAGATDT